VRALSEHLRWSNLVTTLQSNPQTSSDRFGFVVVIIFLIFEYARPQDTVGALGAIHPDWILIGLMVVAWIKGAKRLRMTFSPQTSLILAILALLVIWIPLATNNFVAYSIARGFLLLLPFCASLIFFVNTPDRLRLFLKWWSFLALYIAVKTISGHGVAGSGFLGDENDVALLMNVMLPFVLCMFVDTTRRPVKLTYVAISLLCISAIVSTRSRGGLVGLAAVFFVLWLVSPRKILSLVVTCVLASGLYFAADEGYWARMQTIHDTDQGTAKERLDSWSAGWEMFKDHPFGVGPDNFPIYFPDYQPEGMRHNMWGRAAHSLWFTLLPELGIPGVILYSLLIRANLRSLWRLRNIAGESENRRLALLLSNAFMASIAGFFASGAFLSVLFYPHYWYLTAMVVASQRALAGDTPAVQEPSGLSGATV
jgi:putative inorganic carbon (hco3(-)) transporter